MIVSFLYVSPVSLTRVSPDPPKKVTFFLRALGVDRGSSCVLLETETSKRNGKWCPRRVWRGFTSIRGACSTCVCCSLFVWGPLQTHAVRDAVWWCISSLIGKSTIDSVKPCCFSQTVVSCYVHPRCFSNACQMNFLGGTPRRAICLCWIHTSPDIYSSQF